MTVGRPQNSNKNLLEIQKELEVLKSENGRIEHILFKLEGGEVHVEKRTFGVFQDVLHLFGQDQDQDIFKDIGTIFNKINVDDVLGNEELEKSVDTLKKICFSVLQERYFLKEEEKEQLQATITHLEGIQKKVEQIELLRNVPKIDASIEEKRAFLSKAYAILPVEESAIYYLYFIEQEESKEIIDWVREQKIKTPEELKKLQNFVQNAFINYSSDVVEPSRVLEKIIGSCGSLLEKPNGMRMVTSLFSLVDAIREKTQLSKDKDFFEVQKKVLEKRVKSGSCDYRELGSDFIRCVAALYPHQYDKIMNIIHATILPSLDLKKSKEFLKGIQGYIRENAVIKNARLFEEYVGDIVQSIEHGEKRLFIDIEEIKNKIRNELSQKSPNYQKIGRYFSDIEALDTKQIAKKNLERFLYTEIAGFSEDAILHRKNGMSSADMKSFISGVQENSLYRKQIEEIHDRIFFFKENREDTVSLSFLTHDIFTHPNKFKSDVEEYKNAREKNEHTDPKQYTLDVHRESIFIQEQLCLENEQKEQIIVENLEQALRQIVSEQNLPWVIYQLKQLLTQSIINTAVLYTVGMGIAAKQMQDILGPTVACSAFENKLHVQGIVGMQYYDTQRLQGNEEKRDQFAIGIELEFDLNKMNEDDFLYTEGCCSSFIVTRYGAKSQKEIEDLLGNIRDHGVHFEENQAT